MNHLALIGCPISTQHLAGQGAGEFEVLDHGDVVLCGDGLDLLRRLLVAYANTTDLAISRWSYFSTTATLVGMGLKRG